MAGNPLETRPKRVALVALGPSFHDFIREAVGRKGQRMSFDEVWTVNRGMFAFRHDKVFLMDDLRWVEQHDMEYAEAIRKHDKPVITCTVYPEYPTAVAYPLGKVIGTIGDDLLNNTVAYAIAYGMCSGVEEMSIFGGDFFYPEVQMREEGSQACAYLLGMAQRFGMRFRLPQSTTLLCANTVKLHPETNQVCRPLYGYHRTQELKDVPTHPFVQKLNEMRSEGYGGVRSFAGGPIVEEDHGSVDDPRIRDSGGDGGPAAPADQGSALSAAVLGRGAGGIREGGDPEIGGWVADPQSQRPGVVSRGGPEGAPGQAGGNGSGHVAGQAGNALEEGEADKLPDGY